MTGGKGNRRLSAVLIADIAGYTKLVEQDTDSTVEAWMAVRTNVIDPTIQTHSGRIVKYTGDGFLAEFLTVQDAVECAIAMQKGLSDSPLDFRMGVNLGDIVDDGTDIHGEGVNIAARIEALAEPGGISISGGAFEQVRNRIEAVFDDLGEHEVKHVSAPVRVYRIVQTLSTGAASIGADKELPKPEKTSIAVLPFDNMSGDPDQEYFADGISEDIITALSNVRAFTVLARNSTFAYKGKSVDAREIGRELGVHYMLEGSVRRSGERVRVTAQLIDTKTGDHIWAERYDGALDDIFDLQDRITATIVGTIEPELIRAEGIRLQEKPPDNLNAYDHLLRGVAFMHKVTPEDTSRALECFERAIQFDPNYGRAYAFASWCYRRDVQQKGLLAVSEDEREKAVEYARQALRCDRNDPFVLLYAAATFYQILGDFDEALALINRALKLNPNSHRFWNSKAQVHAFRGETTESIEAGNRAISISPNEPAIWIAYWAMSEAYFQEENYEEAIDFARRAIHHNEYVGQVYFLLAAALTQFGRSSEASSAMVAGLNLCPQVTVGSFSENFQVSRFNNLTTYLEALRVSGMPE